MPTSNADKVATQVVDLAEDLDDACEDGLDDGMGEVAERIQDQIQAQDAFATGNLYLQTRSTVQPSAPTVAAKQRISIPGVYKYVEYGTGPKGEGRYKAPDGPSHSMLTSLQDWIEAKPVVGIYYDHTADEDGISPLAEAIGISISEFGTAPKPFVRPVWRGPNGKLGVRNDVARQINRTIRRS